MKKLFSFLGVALAILILLPTHAYPRGGRRSEPTPTPTPAPTPTPPPAPVAVQGIISAVTPFAVSIKTDPQATALVFKVSNDTVITLNSSPATIADLKPGMPATILPAADNVYAASVTARNPVAAPSATPVANAPAPQAEDPFGAAPSTGSQGGVQSPFGRQAQ